jgi:hypothetical protein
MKLNGFDDNFVVEANEGFICDHFLCSACTVEPCFSYIFCMLISRVFVSIILK